MDELYLDVSQRMDPHIGIPYYEVDIVINGRELIDLVREVELPFAEAEGQPELADRYQNHTSDIIFLPSRHFLPETGADITDVFICFCGESYCWPLRAQITVEEERITWSDFHQPHRRDPKGPVWRYDGLGPFVFDRRQYEAELGKMLANEAYQEAQRRRQAWLAKEEEEFTRQQNIYGEQAG